MKIAILGAGLAGLTAAVDLVDAGHAVDLYSPGNSFGNAFSHHSIKRSKRRGFQASSVVKNLGNRIDEINLADVVLIDWPIFAIAKKIKPPVILMDRSPPADSGFLAMLQWKPWYKACLLYTSDAADE